MPMNNRLLRPTTGLDPDAARYLAAVEAADGEPLEPAVRTAIIAFFAALKADSLWDAIGSTCLLSGPRTLAGALVPLKGDAPTAYGFVEGDYDREGLAGDGTSYLDSGRAGDDDLQDDCHAAVFVQVVPTNNARYLGAVASAPTRRTVQIGTTGGNDFHALSNGSDLYGYGDGYKTGLLAASRASGSGYTGIRNGSTTPVTASSTARIADNVIVFGENANGVAASFTNATLAFYSLGSSLDLAKLDSHVSAYVTAIGAAV